MRSRRAIRSGITYALLFGLLFASIFYPQVLTWLARFLLVSQQPERADLILVLGGDFYGPRTLLGAELGARGYAQKVMISGPPYHNQPESELAIRYLVGKGYPQELFASFPITAGSTVEEAIAVCPELRRLGARSVLIVTALYHSRRANLVFRLFCPGISFRSVGAADAQFEPQNWWRTERFRKIFFSEWQKIIATIFWKYPEYNLSRLAISVRATLLTITTKTHGS